MSNYPMKVNGWEFSGDGDSMAYIKTFNDGRSEAVALCWLDVVEGDDGYNPEGDCYCCLWAENSEFEDALDSLYYSNWTFGDVTRRKDAIKNLIEYMENH